MSSQLIKAQNALNAGDVKACRRFIQRHLENRPADVDALYLLGVCEQTANNSLAAIEILERVLAIQPAHFGAHYSLGLIRSNLGDDVEAIRHQDQAIRLQPQQFWAYINRGNSQAKLKAFDLAIVDYQTALTIQPNIPEAYSNLGNALSALARFEESLDSFNKALQLRPRYPEALSNRSAVLSKLKRSEDALSGAEAALDLAPNYAEAWLNRGMALKSLRRHADALASYERALELKPDYADAWLSRGLALSDIKRRDDAIACYDRALQFKPDYAGALASRGAELFTLKHYLAALESIDHALQLDPSLGSLLGIPIHSRCTLCDWKDLDVAVDALTEKIANHVESIDPWIVLSVLDSPLLQREAAATWVKDRCTASLALPPAAKHQRPKIRLAYFSADFKMHAVSLLAAQLFELHDRGRFEIFAFSFGMAKENDDMRQRLERAFDQFIDVQGKSDLEIARLARELEIDIAVDLNGHTQDNRTTIFSYRAAPIQVNYLGFPGTTGAPFMDYILCDAVVCPPGSEAFYTEKPARLPNCFMPHDSTQAISDRVFTRAEFGLPEDGFVFCCFNNHYKINPTIFDVWMRLLQQVPGSVLWLSDGNQIIKDNLAKEATARGVDPTRLVFAKRLESMAEHLARYRLADLFLDTPLYNAHTTACDSLWAGVPVLTCAGESFASRVAASLLTNIELPELVTNSLEDYEALAFKLATHPEMLATIRQKLSDNRLNTPLFDTKRLARDMEKLFSTMYQRYQDGLQPEQIQSGQWANPLLKTG